MTRTTGDRISELDQHFSARALEHFRPLVTPALIEEHRKAPLAVTNPALRHLLDLVRQAPAAGKLAVLAVVPGSSYQVIRLSGRPGVPNDLSDTRRYASEDAVLHEVFLRRLAALGLLDRVPGDDTGVEDPAPVVALPRIIGYTDRLAVTQGRAVGVHLSGDGDVTATADLVTMGYGLPTGEVREEVVAPLGEVAVTPRRTVIGSTAVTGPLTVAGDVVAVIFMPTNAGDGRQVIVAQDDWSFGLDPAGRPEWIRSGRAVVAPEPLVTGVWYLAAIGAGSATVTSLAGGRSAWTSGVTLPPLTLVAGVTVSDSGRVSAAAGGSLGSSPLRFAARTADGGWGDCFDGKIETPVLLAGTTPGAVISAALGGTRPRDQASAVVVWDIAANLGPAGVRAHAIPAFSPAGAALPDLDAECVNAPAWAVTSSEWDGVHEAFHTAPQEWAAVHFHRDDLDDCRWPQSLSVDIPGDLRSGAYAIRLSADGFETERLPIFVEPATPTAKFAVIVPTLSYLAYANDHPGTQAQMAQATASRTPVLMDGDMYMHDHPELGLALYDAHADGSGSGYSSLRRPLLNMRPTHRYHVGAWQLPADLHLLSWLDDEGIDYDIVTDHTLHERGLDALAPYAAATTTSHSEYYTTSMLDAVEQYVGTGGRFMYVGANGFYWRVVVDPLRPWVMELRRGDSGSRAWQARPGEFYHAYSGEKGGRWHTLGRGTNQLFNVGFCAQGFDSAGWFRRLDDAADPRAAFIFAGVEGDTFGRLGTEGGAAGQEIDRYDPALGSPPGTLVLATSEGLSEGYIRAVEEIYFLVSGTTPSTDPYVRADVTYRVNEAGGAMFTTGSISWCGSLGEDPAVSRITRNVIRRFTDPFPLEW
jgi:N,N-dimethylformamidase